MRTPLIVLTLVIACAAGDAARGDGAPGLIRPKRLVHHFHFEERPFGNFESLPMHWYVTGRPAETSDLNFARQPHHRALIERDGFPAWAEVRFDRRHARSGEFSFHLGLNGGNAGAFLEVGTLPAVPSSDYLVSAFVRTQGMRRAGARIVAYFIDAAGMKVPGSRAASRLVHDADEWTEITVRLSGEFPDAAWIGLELEALQPTAVPGDPLGNQQVVLRDVGGGAWFDDISVWQLPHVEIATQSPVNIIRAPDRPRFGIDVRDLTGQRLFAELTLYDHNHRPVAQEQRQVGGGAAMNWRWTPELPAYGWYLLDMTIHEHTPGGDAADGRADSPVARTLAAVLWMPPDHPLPSADRNRFAIVAEDLPPGELSLLPGILEAARLDSAVISAWSRDTTLASLPQRQQDMDRVLRELLIAGRSVTMSLHPVPQALAETPGIESSHPLGVLRGSPEAWLPYLAPVLMRQGQRVRQWQLGQSQDAEAFFHGDLPSLLARIDDRFQQLAPEPRLILPWRLDQSRRPELSDEVVLAMDVTPAVSPRHLGDHLAEWRGRAQDPAPAVWLYLRSSPADEVPHQGRVVDLALRMIHGWESDAAALALPRPWTPHHERRLGVWPDPVLGVFSTVSQRLAGRRVIGRLRLSEHAECLILDGERGGMLVAINRGGEPRDAVLDMYLGESPVAVDLWGNRTPLPLRAGRHRVSFADQPVFIEGIDPELAMFRASFTVKPGFVESLQAPHEHEVELRNPWGRTISGRLQFTGPAGWSVQPVQHFFSLTPGQTMRLPITMTFPFAELAGPKQLTARFDFTADRHYEVDLATPLELGLRAIEFHPTVAIHRTDTPGVADVEVVCIITNTGPTPRTLSAFINLRNHPRIERPIANLMPGQSIVRRFTIPAVTDEDRAAPLRVGLRETNGPAVLNKQLDLR